MDNSSVICSLITGILALVGTMTSVFVSNKKTIYRIEEKVHGISDKIGQLEKKQDKHNKVIERVYRIEEDLKFHKEKIENLEDKIE